MWIKKARPPVKAILEALDWVMVGTVSGLVLMVLILHFSFKKVEYGKIEARIIEIREVRSDALGGIETHYAFTLKDTDGDLWKPRETINVLNCRNVLKSINRDVKTVTTSSPIVFKHTRLEGIDVFCRRK